MFPSGAQEKFNKKGDGQREMMPRGARSSESDRITGKLPQKDAGQRTSSVGSDGSTQGGKTEAKPTEHAESKGQECFRWGGGDHLVRDCKAQLVCINCGFNHLSDRCVMLNRPHHVLKLAGCAANGIQMMIAQTEKKKKFDKNT